MNAFTDLVGCTVPVQQAPMGSVSTPELAVAVARAGALGTVGALASPEELNAVCDAAGDASLAFNVLVPAMNPATLEIAAARCRVVDFFWGPIDPAFVATAKHGGALASWQVGSLENARLARDAGCDILIAQGREAGGHHDGAMPLRELLDAMLAEFDVPILAAGGIATGDDLADVMRAGAAGARVGTRFIATPESAAHPDYVRAILDAGADDFAETRLFDVGCPLCPSTHGVLKRSVEAASALTTDAGSVTTSRGEFAVPRYSAMAPMRNMTGHVDAMCMYAGSGVGRIHEIRPATEIVSEFARAVEGL